MLMPKKVKYRKQQRGSNRGVAERGATVSFGDYGLQATERGWDVRVLATTTVTEYFFASEELARLSGHPVRGDFRRPGSPGALPRAAAAIVAPATYNTINKWAAGVADNFVLSTLAELTGARVPIAVLPFVNTSFAANRAYQRSVAELKDEGVLILDGPGQTSPHAPSAGTQAAADFAWSLALNALQPTSG